MVHSFYHLSHLRRFDVFLGMDDESDFSQGLLDICFSHPRFFRKESHLVIISIHIPNIDATPTS